MVPTAGQSLAGRPGGSGTAGLQPCRGEGLSGAPGTCGLFLPVTALPGRAQRENASLVGPGCFY